MNNFLLPDHAWLVSGSIFVAVVILLLVFHKYRVELIRKEEQQKRVLLEESLRLHIFELQAQMRPHFIFNAINSIQSYILNQDIDQSLHYISLFSKLIRRTLESAGQQLVPLTEELDGVTQFLEIEKMRFSGLLDYSLDVSSVAQPETIHIPPMILQPFIDIAIRQGLRQKLTAGFIKVELHSSNEHTLMVTITDNGPGWKKRIDKDPPPPEPGPESLKLLASRIDLLNSLNNTNVFKLQITDLYEPNGDCSGTVIRLSYFVRKG